MSIKSIYKKFLEESVNVGIYAFLFLLPWQTRLILRSDDIGYLEVGVYAVDLLLIFCFLFHVIPNLFRNLEMLKLVQHDKIKLFINIVFACFLSWNVISIFWSSDKILAMQHVFWLLLAVGLGWLVATYENKLRLLFWLVMGLMVSAWLGVWQFFAQYAFANKWLGLAYHNPQDSGTSYLEVFSDGKMIHWLRSYGSFDHPNIFGFAMVLGIISTLWMFYEKKNSKIVTAFLYLALVSLVTGLYASLSRGAFLGLAIALVTFFLKTHFSNMKKPLVAAGMSLAIIASLYSAPLFARSNINARLEQKSINEREIYFQQAKEIIKQHPIVGVGAGSYIDYLKEKNPNNYPWNYQPVHNVFMLIWAEIGLVGMLAFVVLYVTIIVRAYKNSPLSFCLLLAFLPAMFFDHWLWSLHFGLLFLGLINGLILNKRFLAAVDI